MFDRRSAVRERRGQDATTGQGDSVAFAPEAVWTSVLFDRAPLPIWIVDRESLKFLAVNDAALARYGYGRDEFLRMRLCEVQPEQGTTATRCADAPSGAPDWSTSRRHRWKDGSTREVTVVEEDVRFRERDARLMMIEDVSERVEAEESRALLLAAIDQLDEIVFLVRPQDGNRDGDRDGAAGAPQIVFVNAALERTLGIAQPGMAIGVYHRDSSPELLQIQELVAQGLDCDRNTRCETNWQSPSGRMHCLEISSVPLRTPDRDALSHWAVVVRDITPHKALTERTAHAQRLESLGLLAGSVAHDFNNLMHVVTGFSELAIAQLQPRVPAATYMQQAHEAALRASSLAKQLLAFSRRQSVKSVRLDMRGLVDGLEPVLSRLAGPRVPVRIRTGDEPAMVCADPTQLEQILLNLVVNARDAQPTGGWVDVVLDVVNADDAAIPDSPGPSPHASRWIRICVTDAGPGMPSEVQARVFEPFFTTKSQGTGLGLSTVHRIVKEGGGVVRLNSPAEGGLQVEILLPESAP